MHCRRIDSNSPRDSLRRAPMTKRTPQLESAILNGFAAGRRLLDMCRENGVAPSTVQHWKHNDEDFARRYAQAQADHAEILIDEGIGIADDPTSSWVQRRLVDADPGYVDHIRHARLRMDARFKAAAIHLRRHDAAVARREDREEAERQRQAEAANRLPDIAAVLQQADAETLDRDPPFIVATTAEPPAPQPQPPMSVPVPAVTTPAWLPASTPRPIPQPEGPS